VNPPRQSFSWDGDDVPVPLGAAAPDDPGRPVAPQILGEAETEVRDARDESMVRRSTDSEITMPVPASNGAGPGSRRMRDLPRESRPTYRSPVVILAASCAVAFFHGWTVGSAAGAHSPSNAVMRTTVRPARAGNEWKETQSP
jgi:hypothetical protein